MLTSCRLTVFVMLLQVKVRRVRVVGLNRTKNDIVVEQVKGVLKATTLYEVVISHTHAFRT